MIAAAVAPLRILRACETRLATIPGVRRLELMPSAAPDLFPALGILCHGWRVLETGAEITRYELAITIDGFAQGDDAVDAISLLYAQVVAALVSDPAFVELGGFVELIDEGDTVWDVAELASDGRLGFATDFTVQFITPRGNPAP